MSLIENMKVLTRRFTQSDLFMDAQIDRQRNQQVNRVTGKRDNLGFDTIECRAVASLQTVKIENGAALEMTMVVCDVEMRSGDIIRLNNTDYTVGQVTVIAPHGEAFLWKAVAE